jgi:hypothetical protein
MTPAHRYRVREHSNGAFAIIDTEHGKNDGHVANLCIGYIDNRDTADLIVEALNKMSPIYEAIGELVTLPPTPPELQRFMNRLGQTATTVLGNPDSQPNWFKNGLKAVEKTSAIEIRAKNDEAWSKFFRAYGKVMK